MRAIGITGHTRLTEHSRLLVLREMLSYLRQQPRPVHGVSCLAAGADQLFVEAIVAVGGSYEVILPIIGYRDRVIRPADRRHFDSLVEGAERLSVLPYERPGAAAYARANGELVARSRSLLAVWDGVPDPRPGTTAHTIRLARRHSVPVTRIWPAKARRAQPRELALGAG